MVELTQQVYPNYNIGRYTYGKSDVLSWGEGTTLENGAFCSIADGVKISLGGKHRVNWVTTCPFNVLWQQANHIKGHHHSKGDVIIGNDVWIGETNSIMFTNLSI
jgi:acetyltransferase-like isoleucine patch superfamily enzyme